MTDHSSAPDETPDEIPDEHQRVQDSLVQRFAVKTGDAWKMWRREAWPEQVADEPRWPLRLMEVGRRGDQLWWFCSPAWTWKHLCGCAGWALLREGNVIDTEMVMIN